MPAKATVLVTLQVSLSDSWSDNCTIDQVRRQAVDGATGIISKMINRNDKVKIISNFRFVEINVTQEK